MKARSWSIAILVVYGALVTYTTTTILLGLSFQPFFTPLLSLLAFTFALLHAAVQWGWRKALLLLGLTFAVSLLFESVGVVTGWIYGPYHYTDKLGPKFLGLVPLLIPVAWFMMTYPCVVIAEHLAPPVRSIWGWRLLTAAFGALAMTAWDLAMDPMMVAGEYWVWEVPGVYFGVPLQNYWGWWLTTFVTFLLYLIIGRVTPRMISDRSNDFSRSPSAAIPPNRSNDFSRSPSAVIPHNRSNDFSRSALRYERLAILSYSITGLSSVIVDFRFGLGGPGLVGLFAMLPWALFAWQERGE